MKIIFLKQGSEKKQKMERSAFLRVRRKNSGIEDSMTRSFREAILNRNA
jgi:hypothetical protein